MIDIEHGEYVNINTNTDTIDEKQQERPNKITLLYLLLVKYVKMTINDNDTVRRIKTDIENCCDAIITLIISCLICLNFTILARAVLDIVLMHYAAKHNSVKLPNNSGMANDLKCFNNVTYYNEDMLYCGIVKNYYCLKIIYCELLLLYIGYIANKMPVKRTTNNKKTKTILILMAMVINYCATIYYAIIHMIYGYGFFITSALLCLIIVDVIITNHVKQNYYDDMVKEYKKIESYELEIIDKQNE